MAIPPPDAQPPRFRLGFTRRLLLLAFLAGVPATLLALGFIWAGPHVPEFHAWLKDSRTTQAVLTVILVGFLLGTVLVLRVRLIRPLGTLSNVLSGLREGDYSFQARGAAKGDPLGEVMLEVNALVETMRQQRLGALEATALLRTVMAEIDVAVFAFDGNQRLRLVNRAGEQLLAQPTERLQGRDARELGLGECLEGEAPRTVRMSFPGSAGRWGIHRRQFRGGGLPHQLLVLTDLSRELREEEKLAWQRLVRVMGHELNNSLAPVKSIAGSLETLLQREPLPADWKEDMRDGLRVIATRADALNRFVGAYAKLAKLPKPRLQSVDLAALVTRVASLETRVSVTVQPGPELSVAADPDQLEQILINLVRNAADAVLESAPREPGTLTQPSPPTAGLGVRVSWAKTAAFLEVAVEDDGPGLANTANLFVPFFTTKQTGSGIGLLLSRQIAEGHGGSLALENRVSARGCVARLRLPLAQPVEPIL